MSTTQAPAIDMKKLNALIRQFVTDLYPTHTGMVVLGEKLGLYKTSRWPVLLKERLQLQGLRQ